VAVAVVVVWFVDIVVKDCWMTDDQSILGADDVEIVAAVSAAECAEVACLDLRHPLRLLNLVQSGGHHPLLARRRRRNACAPG